MKHKENFYEYKWPDGNKTNFISIEYLIEYLSSMETKMIIDIKKMAQDEINEIKNLYDKMNKTSFSAEEIISLDEIIKYKIENIQRICIMEIETTSATINDIINNISNLSNNKIDENKIN